MSEAKRLQTEIRCDTTIRRDHQRARELLQVRDAFRSEGDLEQARSCAIEGAVFLLQSTQEVAPGRRYQGDVTPAVVDLVPDWTDVNSPPTTVCTYLRNASEESVNPIHRARFRDFLWDKSKDHVAGRAAIADYLATLPRYVANEWFMEVYDSVRRVSQLVKTFRVDPSAAADAIMAALRQMESAGRYPWIGRIAQQLPRGTQSVVLREAVDLLRRVSDHFSAEGDYHFANITLGSLAELWVLLGERDSKRAVDVEVGEVMMKHAEQEKARSHMAAAHHYQDALNHFQRIDHHVFDDVLRLQIRECNRIAAATEMKAFSFPLGVTPDELEPIVASHVLESLDESLLLLAWSGIPSVERARQRADQNKGGSLFRLLAHRTQVTGDGRIISSPQDDGDEEEDQLIEQIVLEQNLWNQLLLGDIFNRLRECQGLNSDTFMAYLGEKELFKGHDNALVAEGVRRYFDGDYIGSLHILSLQVEVVLRRLLEEMGRPGVVPSRESPGVRVPAPLNVLLADPDITGVLGKDISTYLSVVLTDERGMNLRNRVAHGMLLAGEAHSLTCEVLLHVYLIMGRVRRTDPS